MDENVQQKLLAEVEALLEPVTGAATSAARRQALFAGLGWDPGAAVGMPAGELEAWLAHAASVVDGVQRFAADPPDTLPELADALAVTDDAVEALRGFPPGLAGGGPQLPPADVLASDLVTLLTTGWMERRHPKLYRLLILLTLLEPADGRPVSDPFPATGDPIRLPVARPALRLDRLGSLLTDPVGALKTAYFPHGLDTIEHADAAADTLFPRIAALLRELGGQALYGLDPDVAPPLDEAALALASHMLSVSWEIPFGEVVARLGATFGLSAAETGGLGLLVVPSGGVELKHVVGGWALGLAAEGSAGGFAIGPAGVTVAAGNEQRISIRGMASKLPAVNGQAFLVGSTTGTRLEIGELSLSLGVAFGGGRDDVETSAQAKRAALVVAPGDGDGFLAMILPKEGVRAEFELGVAWSLRKGFHISGGAGFDATLPLHVALGPLEVFAVHVRMNAAAEGIGTALSASASLKLGPIAATVEQIGVRADGTFPPTGGNLGPANVTVAFKPPAGVGLVIDAGPVTGGGYLFFDPDKQQYAGVLQLEFSAIALKAVGLLTTRMPDGSPGFSLLVIISAEFTPIQLGFGFTLSGVGGLLGVNRTAAVEPLRAGLRNRTLDSILFPKDPVANAPKLVSDLGLTFPVAVGRHVFGPMARINWGTPALITLELGLVLELPAPVRLLILGRLRMALPREEAAIVRINMDVLGVIDFGRGEASIDATLYDSTVAGFTLSGDMAMRMSWRENPGFALSAGGFHPRFQPPPGFPALRRLTLALATGDNPRLRLETYLALTSNTAQIGARLELYAAAAGFSIEGLLYFDALFRFDPFSFVVDMGGSLALKQGSRTLMSVSVDVTLSGPNPWHAAGRATFSILFFKASVSFDTTFGERQPEPLPPPVDVGALLDAALSDPRNWSAQLPAGGSSILTLRDIRPAAGELLAHPLGTLTVAQRVVPFGVQLERYGTSRLAAGSESVFNVTKLRIDTATPDSTPIQDLFAPAQFHDLTDDEKLSAPSFQRQDAGRRLASAAIAFDTTTLTPMALDYETAIIDAPDAPAREAAAAIMDASTLLLRSAAGPAAFAPARTTGADRFAAEGLELGVAG